MLRDLRYAQSLTIKELAGHLSIEEKRIKVIERGFSAPTPHEKEALSNFFSVSKNKLFKKSTRKRRNTSLAKAM